MKSLTFGLLLTACLGGASAEAAAKTPPCDEIDGVLIAQSPTWRVVSANPYGTYVACRRGGPAGGPVRVVGPKGFEVSVVSLEGRRLTVGLDSGISSQSEGIDYRVIDLGTGKSTRLGSVGGSTDGTWSNRRFVLPDGRVVGQNWRTQESGASGNDIYSFHPMTTWSSRGKAVAGPVGWAAAASPGAAPTGPGVYYTTPTGAVGRLTPSAHATGPPSLSARYHRWRRDLKLTRDSQAAARAQIPSYDSLLEAAVVPATATQGPAIELRSSKARVELADDQVDVLGQRYDELLVAARFADAPGERRVRLLSFKGEVQADLPDTPLLHEPGRTLIHGSLLLVGGDDVLRIYSSAAAGTTQQTDIPVAGAHDMTGTGGDVVYFTTPDGRPGRLWSQDARVCNNAWFITAMPTTCAGGHAPAAPSAFLPKGD